MDFEPTMHGEIPVKQVYVSIAQRFSFYTLPYARQTASILLRLHSQPDRNHKTTASRACRSIPMSRTFRHSQTITENFAYPTRRLLCQQTRAEARYLHNIFYHFRLTSASTSTHHGVKRPKVRRDPSLNNHFSSRSAIC